jgi:hypothetical protein
MEASLDEGLMTTLISSAIVGTAIGLLIVFIVKLVHG